jgi:hypothetical protein
MAWESNASPTLGDGDVKRSIDEITVPGSRARARSHAWCARNPVSGTSLRTSNADWSDARSGGWGLVRPFPQRSLQATNQRQLPKQRGETRARKAQLTHTRSHMRSQPRRKKSKSKEQREGGQRGTARVAERHSCAGKAWVWTRVWVWVWEWVGVGGCGCGYARRGHACNKL